MKKLFFIVCATLLCSATVYSQATITMDVGFEESTIAKSGDAAPEFKVQMLDGTTVNVGDIRGKVVLVTFWATWCPPCRAELARARHDIAERYAGKDLVWLPISRGEAVETVEKFMEKSGYTFNPGLDPDKKIFEMFATNYIPRNFLIDRDGIVRLATTGYEPEEFDAMLVVIDRLLVQ